MRLNSNQGCGGHWEHLTTTCGHTFLVSNKLKNALMPAFPTQHYLLASPTLLGFWAVCRAMSLLSAVEALLRLWTLVHLVAFLAASATSLRLWAVRHNVSFFPAAPTHLRLRAVARHVSLLTAVPALIVSATASAPCRAFPSEMTVLT